MSAITFNKKTYSDTASSGSGLVAADMNKIEQAIVDLNSAVTKLQDSVSRFHTGKVFVGSVVRTIQHSTTTGASQEAFVFSKEDFTSTFGRAFNPSKDYIGVMNGDGDADNYYLTSVTYWGHSGHLWVGVPDGNGKSIRLNYIVVLGN